ncbi:MAG: hypothetical protein J6Y08_03215 [Clostridiales bacterium]|nr:hypothetical protein [Clostridiales bacterium]
MKKNSRVKNDGVRTPKTSGKAFTPDRNLAKKNVDIEPMDILLRVLVLLTPALVALISGLALQNDIGDFIAWWALFYLYSWAAFPITAHFFRGFLSAGYGFARGLGILLTTGPLWLLSYLGIWNSFNRPMTFVMFVILAAVCWGLPATRKAAIVAIADNNNVGHIIFEEALFTVVLAFLCYCKGFLPNINGEEKFMNFGFMNSMVRNNSLPAKDHWLAGYSINYYYYGQYVFSYLTKMLGTKTSVAYNISLCAAIAIPFSTAFSLGQMFIDGLMQKKDSQVAKIYLPFAGLLSGCCTIIFGNSHSFFYDEQSIGNRILHWGIWQKLGINVGNTTDFFYPNSTRFIGHNPNLKELGLAETADLTIHEFPFYSFLVGDLHAHVISMMIVTLIIAFIFVAVFRAKFPEKRNEQMYRFTDLHKHLLSETDFLFQPEFLFAAYLLGLAQMCNYWDFLIYFIFCSMGLLVYHARRSTHLVTFTGFLVFLVEAGGILGVYLKFGDNVFLHLCLQIAVFVISYVLSTCIPCAFSRTGAGMAMLFSIASTISLSFNYNFEMISNSIGLVDHHTSPFQFTVVWMVHVLIPLGLLLLVVFTKRNAYKKNRLPVLPEPLKLVKPTFGPQDTVEYEAAPVSEAVASAPALKDDPDILDDVDTPSEDPDLVEIASVDTESEAPRRIVKTEKAGEESDDEEEEKDPPRFIGAITYFFRLLDYYFAKFGDFLMCRFFNVRSIIDIFMVGMSFVGFMMLMAPEIMYVRDIYGDDFQRSNTMFKFTFAAFIILSLVVAYTVFRFMAHVTKKGSLSNWGLGVAIFMLALILFIPGHYTMRSLEQRCGKLNKENYKGLDGTAYLTTHTSSYTELSYEGNLIPYQEAINWLNENVKGTKNICEASGLSYTDRCIVSAYTGLPTVVGWQTHEWLWHFQGIVDPETGKFEADPNNDVWKIILTPRYQDLTTIYTSTELEEVYRLLHFYDISYVICGTMELKEYSVINYSTFDTLGECVFTSSDGTLRIYKVQ